MPAPRSIPAPLFACHQDLLHAHREHQLRMPERLQHSQMLQYFESIQKQHLAYFQEFPLNHAPQLTQEQMDHATQQMQ